MLALFLESPIVFLSFNMKNEIMIIMWSIYLAQDAMRLLHFYFVNNSGRKNTNLGQ